MTNYLRWLRLFARFSLLLLAALYCRSAGASVPSVAVVNNAPGMNTISWAAPPVLGWVLSYVVERESPAASWSYEVRAGSHVDLGLQPSTTYRYRVCELNVEADCSAWFAVTTMPAASASDAYPAPTFTSYRAGTTDIQLSWTAARSYGFFQVRRDGMQWRTGGGSGNSFAESNLQSNRDYTYIVQGCSRSLIGSNCSGWSVPITVRTQPPPPPPPPNDAGVLYGVNADNELRWYRHDGYVDGTFTWGPNSGASVGTGWQFKQLFSGGDGVLYAITEAGELLWYRHEGREDGSFAWAAGSGAKVGSGWSFKHVFSDGGGIIYAITDSGDVLWYSHQGYRDGSFRWAPNSGAKIAEGWDHFRQVFAAGGGVIYAVTEETGSLVILQNGEVGPRTPAGNLLWYRHEGRANGSPRWAPNSGNVVGLGWNFRQLFAGTDGALYAVTERVESEALDPESINIGHTTGPASYGGDLLWYGHAGREDGSFVWTQGSGSRVGTGWHFEHLFGIVE